MVSKMDGAILALTSSLLESAVADEAAAEVVESVVGSLDGTAQDTMIGLARMHRVKAMGSRARIAALAESYGHRFWSPVI